MNTHLRIWVTAFLALSILSFLLFLATPRVQPALVPAPVVSAPTPTPTLVTYASSTMGITVRYPAAFTPDDTYSYKLQSPERNIRGVKLTIPRAMATGTNLSADSYISIEKVSGLGESECNAGAFFDQPLRPEKIIEGEVAYTIASSTGAAAGNRYEEMVYAISGTSPCVAIRYFIHYGVIENYPRETIREFDKKVLVGLFDTIRRTVVVAD